MIMTKFLKHFRRFGRNKISFAGILIFPMAALAATTQPAVITLPANVTVAEIQRVLDALPVAGGEVILPAGKIEVSQPIVLHREGQALRGAGDQTILFLADNANCPVIIMGEP